MFMSFSAQPAGLEQQMTPDKVLSLLADKRLHRLAVIAMRRETILRVHESK